VGHGMTVCLAFEREVMLENGLAFFKQQVATKNG